MHAAAGAISRARARARAHRDMAGDGLERGETQGLQNWVITHLTHAWPRARQVKETVALTTLEFPALTKVTGNLDVRAHPCPRSADRARRRAHRAEPALPPSLRLATRASDK